MHFPIIIQNEELGALAQGLLVPGYIEVSRLRGHLRITCCFLDLVRYLGVWVTSESTRPVGEETRKLRAEHRASISGRQTSQKLPHCVQDSPAPRRQRVTQQRSLEPMAASVTQDCCWLGAGLLG